MKKGIYFDSKEAKERKQKESHSEIERKRRERMKKETEYLNLQLPEADRKDKLSVFQAGCDQLISYTDSLSKRDYIITDMEYSTIITNNFSGFDIHIRCHDGKILHIHDKIKHILGQEQSALIGCSIFDVCEPSEHTVQLLHDSLKLSNVEKRSAEDGDLIPRELTIPMRVSEASLHAVSVPSFDHSWYRFIEVCGEICSETDDSSSDGDKDTKFVLKALCRPCDPSVAYGGWGSESQMHITTKHRSDSMEISEVTGQVRDLLGVDPKLLIGKELCDFVPDEEKTYMRKNFQDVLKNGSILFICPMKHQNGSVIRFRIQLTVIDIKGKVQFIIAKSEVANPESDLPAAYTAACNLVDSTETRTAVQGISPEKLITNFPVSRGLTSSENSSVSVCQPCSSSSSNNNDILSYSNSHQHSSNSTKSKLVAPPSTDDDQQNDNIMDLLDEFGDDIPMDIDLQDIVKEELDKLSSNIHTS